MRAPNQRYAASIHAMAVRHSVPGSTSGRVPQPDKLGRASSRESVLCKLRQALLSPPRTHSLTNRSKTAMGRADCDMAVSLPRVALLPEPSAGSRKASVARVGTPSRATDAALHAPPPARSCASWMSGRKRGTWQRGGQRPVPSGRRGCKCSCVGALGPAHCHVAVRGEQFGRVLRSAGAPVLAGPGRAGRCLLPRSDTPTLAPRPALPAPRRPCRLVSAHPAAPSTPFGR